MNPEKGQDYITRLDQILNLDLTDSELFELLYQFENALFSEYLKNENIHLTSLFTKIAFVGNKYSLNKGILYACHTIRKAHDNSDFQNYFDGIDQVAAILRMLIGDLFNTFVNKEYKSLFYEWFEQVKSSNVVGFLKELEVLALGAGANESTLNVVSKQEPYEEYQMTYGEIGKNEFFKSDILFLIKNELFPISLYLHDVEIKNDHVLSPNIIVVQASYLFDVTSISESFKPTGVDRRFALLRKFLPQSSTKYLMIGNIVNAMLDRLIHDPELDYEDFVKNLFVFNPIGFAVFENDVIREILDKIRLHFDNLKKVVQVDFPKAGITKEASFLEPSFYSPKYGLQGRLDLLLYSEDEANVSIVELKSGRPFRPNAYGLSSSHYVQTLLYELLIQSTLGHKHRVNNFILYSQEKEKQLRYAPSIKHQQKEAIKLRNELLLQFYQIELDAERVFSEIDIDRFDRLYGFDLDNVKLFQSVYSSLNSLEKDYFNRFSGFITKEQRLSKIGSSDHEKKRGLALLWESNIEDKKLNFSILNHLKLKEFSGDVSLPIIEFSKTEQTIRLANFRKGDIVIAYPMFEASKTPTESQLIKATIIELSEKKVIIRLRNPQFNTDHFEQTEFWHIEPDMLDSGYNVMYRGLFEWARSEPGIREKVLGLIAPKKGDNTEIELSDPILTPEQSNIIQSIVNANDYYLLWGPPGTGKTSVIIRNVVSYLEKNSGEHLLLLAYTNRAVDEICNAIIGNVDDFIRIGSRYSCHDDYVDNLLSQRVSQLKTRNEIRSLLNNNRVIVGTVSSVLSKIELFELKSFDRIIVDEASQLLEPYVIGLMTRCDRITFIGDHQQLPAVVQQSDVESKYDSEELLELGFKNMRYSLFERLLMQCRENDWHWALGQLTMQGRMHADLMKFPSEQFYNNSLKILPTVDRLSHDAMLSYCEADDQFNVRNLFINCKTADFTINQKISESEADEVVKLIKKIRANFDSKDLKFTNTSLGVITPYRAQIAMITDKCYDAGIDISDITIDTVERYQGGARDIILISLCVNNPNQFRNLMSLSEEGVDRKLNVAITRAREQLILLGDRDILRYNPMYWALVNGCKQIE